MPKDYAKIRRQTSQNDRRFVSGMGLIFAVIFLMAGIAYALYTHQQVFSKTRLLSWLGHAKTVTAPQNVKQVSAQNEEVQFDFYTELPNMQVNLPSSAKAQLFPQKTTGQIDASIQSVIEQHQAKMVAIKKPAAQFFVVIGEFKDLIGASQLRLSLLLAGIETEVIKTEKETYRVQQGPYASERQAKTKERLVNQKGFESTIDKN